MILFFDTETTGLPDWRAPSDAPTQPHLVQLAMLLVDEETRQERGLVDLIIKPTDWNIPKEASDIHGITDEMAHACGVSERLAVATFAAFYSQAKVACAHNVSFDTRIMRIALLRHGRTREQADDFESSKPKFCTMKAAQPIVALPPTEKMKAAGFTHFKSPTVGECIRHFFDEELAGAHNALIDARAAARIYWAVADHGG